MKTSSKSPKTSDESRRGIAYAIALVDLALACFQERDKRLDASQLPPAPHELPLRFCCEFFAIVVYLHRLRSAGMFLAHDAQFPTVPEALIALKSELEGSPEKFSEDSPHESDLALERWRRYREFDWLEWNESPIAAVGSLDQQSLEHLVALLWDFRHLGQHDASAVECDAKPAATSQPQRLELDVVAEDGKYGMSQTQDGFKAKRQIRKQGRLANTSAPDVATAAIRSPQLAALLD